MSIIKAIRRVRSKPNSFIPWAFILLLLAAIISILGVTTNTLSAGATPACVGTYLVVEGSGVQSLWTFSRDRTFQLTSSSEDFYSFSHGQGAWRRAGSGTVKMTFLDFVVDSVAPPTSIARVDALLTFSNGCQNVSGSFDLRFFDAATEDPLDISAKPVTTSDTMTGRLVTTD